MKDIPVFTTDYGVACLILREIPYQKVAYFKILEAWEPEKLIDECRKFCRMLDAERIYAAGHSFLESLPLHTAIWRMRAMRDGLGETDAALWPVTEETAERFQALYNEKIPRIPNAAWMDGKDRQEMLASGEGYFVHRAGKLLGIGRVKGEEIRFIASFAPGAGADTVRALAGVSDGASVCLEVASANEKAVALYRRLGFVPVEEKSRWYCAE